MPLAFPVIRLLLVGRLLFSVMVSSLVWPLALLPGLCLAQFPPKPEGVTTLESKFHPGVKISYKEPHICETTPGVRSYSGHVHLPPHSLNEKHENQSYPINTFFWFFEARKDPKNAPLVIWLNGGPGGSSLMGALSENGPCFVNPDSNSTYLNQWSWNNEVNYLVLDQPNEVGFSYDIATNVTRDVLGDPDEDPVYQELDPGDDVPAQNLTFLVGTTGSQKESNTANSTHHAATALWHFAQTWFEEFPSYKPHDNRISIFGESYGGKYLPIFTRFFLEQNDKIEKGVIKGPGAHYLHIDTMGIINGCINFMDQTRGYIDFPVKNTYGIKAFTDAQYHLAEYHFYKEDGLRDRILKCQKMNRETDPHNHADQAEVNDYCRGVYDYVTNYTINAYTSSGEYGWFDITHKGADPFPPPYLTGYLNQHWVQGALGMPVNHSAVSPAVALSFYKSGDHAKGDLLEDIAYILDHGIKVHLIYGDRDYACNWIGGEQSSLNVPWKYQREFSKAGYTPLVAATGPPYLQSSGLTRQFGNFSFTRVYQAGHLVPSYQGEAAYRIFMRALFNKDIATGQVDTAKNANHSTKGPKHTWWMKSEVLPSEPGLCYSLFPDGCSEEEIEWLRDGTAIVKDFVVVGREGQDEAGRSAAYTKARNQYPLQEEL